jgi:hypothetical protein
MFAIYVENIAAELGDVLRPAFSVEFNVFQKSSFVETIEDLVGEIVVANGESMRNDVLNGVDAEITIYSLKQFPGPGSSFRCAGKQVAIEQRLDLHMPDQQYKRIMGCKIFDAKSQGAVNDLLFKPPGVAMENKFKRYKDQAYKEKRDREQRTDEFVIEPCLFFIEQTIDIVGDIGETLHGDWVCPFCKIKKFYFYYMEYTSVFPPKPDKNCQKTPKK